MFVTNGIFGELVILGLKGKTADATIKTYMM